MSVNIESNEYSLAYLDIEALKTVCSEHSEHQMAWVLSLLILNYELL
jgi:hypothetical protein